MDICKGNIFDLLNNSKTIKIFNKKYGFIYCAGLLDYFSDSIALKIIMHLANLLEHKGKLIIGNVSKNNPSIVYQEVLGEWQLNYRDKKQMMKLVNGLKAQYKIDVEYDKETKMNIFLTLEERRKNI